MAVDVAVDVVEDSSSPVRRSVRAAGKTKAMSHAAHWLCQRDTSPHAYKSGREVWALAWGAGIRPGQVVICSK